MGMPGYKSIGGTARDLPDIGQPTWVTVDRIHAGLNLHLKLKNPMQMAALVGVTGSHQDTINNALESLHYVHFARFLPAIDYSALWVVTVFDGAVDIKGQPSAYDDTMRAYITDFAATMGDVFTDILDFVENAPRLPVNRYLSDFVDFVMMNNVENVNPWSAYPEKTVIDIQTSKSQI